MWPAGHELNLASEPNFEFIYYINLYLYVSFQISFSYFDLRKYNYLMEDNPKLENSDEKFIAALLNGEELNENISP